jgi:hypothetical protein
MTRAGHVCRALRAPGVGGCACARLGATPPAPDPPCGTSESQRSTYINPDALRKYPTALAASAFVKRYGSGIAHEVSEVRTALTNKLLEIADCGDIKHELRAIELLGKHVDIGLFTERSEININYKDPESLEKAIKERVKRLLNAEMIDITPVGRDLDEELGVFAPDDEAKDREGDDD